MEVGVDGRFQDCAWAKTTWSTARSGAALHAVTLSNRRSAWPGVWPANVRQTPQPAGSIQEAIRVAHA